MFFSSLPLSLSRLSPSHVSLSSLSLSLPLPSLPLLLSLPSLHLIPSRRDFIADEVANGCGIPPADLKSAATRQHHAQLSAYAAAAREKFRILLDDLCRDGRLNDKGKAYICTRTSKEIALKAEDMELRDAAWGKSFASAVETALLEDDEDDEDDEDGASVDGTTGAGGGGAAAAAAAAADKAATNADGDVVMKEISPTMLLPNDTRVSKEQAVALLRNMLSSNEKKQKLSADRLDRVMALGKRKAQNQIVSSLLGGQAGQAVKIGSIIAMAFSDTATGRNYACLGRVVKLFAHNGRSYQSHKTPIPVWTDKSVNTKGMANSYVVCMWYYPIQTQATRKRQRQGRGPVLHEILDDARTKFSMKQFIAVVELERTGSAAQDTYVLKGGEGRWEQLNDEAEGAAASNASAPEEKGRGRPKKKAKKSEGAAKGSAAASVKEAQKEKLEGKHVVMNIKDKSGRDVQMFGTVSNYKPRSKQYEVKLYKTEEARNKAGKASKTRRKVDVDVILRSLEEEEEDVVMEEE